MGQALAVLVVEDDHAMRSLLCDELYDLGYRILEAADGAEALARIVVDHPALVLTDLRIPGGGFDYISRLRMLAPTCPIMLMTAFGDAHTRTEAKQCGVAAFFDKPVRMSELKVAIRECLERDGGASGSSSK